MPVLTQTRCPQCNGTLPLVKLWWRTNNMYLYLLPTKRLGIACPNCGTALVVLMNGVIAASFLYFLVSVGLVFLWLVWAPHTVAGHLPAASLWLGLLLLVLFTSLLQPRFAMVFAELRAATKGESVDYPLGRPDDFAAPNSSEGVTSNNRWRRP